jgi:outer membrane scaffolding protein for murein synthesis (MipA/OmpV family)
MRVIGFSRSLLLVTLAVWAAIASPVRAQGFFSDFTRAAPSFADRLFSDDPLLPDFDLGPVPGFQVTLGGGPAFLPKYEGDDSYKLRARPRIRVRFKDIVDLDTGGAAVSLIRTLRLRAGPVLSIRGGRREDDSPDLIGLRESATSIETGVFGRFTLGKWTIGGRIAQDIIDGHGGAVAEVGVAYQAYLDPRFSVVVGTHATWASNPYMEAFFGVRPQDVARAGLSAYDPAAGFKDVGVETVLVYRLNDAWFLRGVATYELLIGDAANSPLIRERGSRHQFSSALTINRVF